MKSLALLIAAAFAVQAPATGKKLDESFTRLYLAGAVTTMRTGGNMNGYMDISLKRAIENGQKSGPAIDATAPYVNGPNQFQQMTQVLDADQARRHVAYWADQGATSFKAYMQISRAALRAAIEEAHRRGLKVTGHLCSVSYSEAADLGIDNLEHGFLAATDFVADKAPDQCPGQGQGQQTIATLDEKGAPFKSLVQKLIDKRVALTSTLTVFETFAPGAIYLGRDKSIGSVALGKQADLVVVSGDPSAHIADVRNVELVFRQGIGYDPGKLIASVAGRVGLF